MAKEESKKLLELNESSEEENTTSKTTIWFTKDSPKPTSIANLPPLDDTHIVVIRDKESKSRNRYSIPDDYIMLSLVGFCLFCPIGVCAVRKSIQVQSMFEEGDLYKSRQRSREAKQLAKQAISIGCILLTCVFAFLLTISLIIIAFMKPHKRL